jgi:hypothetical protein
MEWDEESCCDLDHETQRPESCNFWSVSFPGHRKWNLTAPFSNHFGTRRIQLFNSARGHAADIGVMKRKGIIFNRKKTKQVRSNTQVVPPTIRAGSRWWGRERSISMASWPRWPGHCMMSPGGAARPFGFYSLLQYSTLVLHLLFARL